MDGIIYGLFCECHEEKGIRYVGLTTRTLQLRLNEHAYDVRSGSALPVHNWMRVHSWRSRILEDGIGLEDLAGREGYWIRKLQPDKNVDPYGGMGNRSPRTPELKARISKSLKGRKKPDGFGEKISEFYRRRREENPRPLKEPTRPRLQEHQVLSILALKGVVPPKEVGEMFGVHRNSVWHIWTGRSWTKVTGITHV